MNAGEFIEYCPDAVLILNPQGRIQMANQNAVDLYGYDKKALLRMQFVDLILPDNTSDPGKILQALVQATNPVATLHRKRNGRHLPVEVIGRPIPINGENFLLYHVRDITEQKQILLDMLPSLIAYVDEKGYFKMANQLHTSLFACPIEKIINHHMHEVVGDVAWSNIAPYVERVLTGESVDFETERTFPDGSQKWMSVSYTPDIDETGHLRGFVALADDISQAKRQEAELRASEELYRTIARSLPQGSVFVIDRNLQYKVMEGPLMKKFNLDRKMIEGYTPHAINDEEMRNTVLERCQKALAGETQSYETDFFGSILWTQYTPIRDEKTGEVIAAMALSLDVTESRKAAESLREAELRHEVLMSNLPGIAYRRVYNHDCKMTYISNDSLMLTGYTPDEMLEDRSNNYDKLIHAKRPSMGE